MESSSVIVLLPGYISWATAGITQLQLDAGKQWTTDASLRSEMGAIREAFEADHPAIYAGTQTDVQYDALANRIEKAVQTIVANCKLPAEADANLHYIVLVGEAPLLLAFESLGQEVDERPDLGRQVASARIHRRNR